MYKALRFGLPATRKLIKLWSLNRPDIIHIVTEGPLGWSAIRAAKKLGLPTVSDFHTNFHTYSQYYRLGPIKKLVELYLKHFHNRTDRTLVPTHELQKDLLDIGIRNSVVVKRGIDLELFTPTKRDPSLRKSWGLSENQLAVLFVGRLAVEKNIELAIDTYQHMHQVNKQTRMILVGDGPMKEKLASRHNDLIFTGMKKGDNLAKHYASGDILLSPSITETFGNIIVEAMASRLAIVAYNYASAREYLHHTESGVLGSYNNAHEFINAATELVNQPELIEKLRHHAWSNAQSCTWEETALALEKVYTETINK